MYELVLLDADGTLFDYDNAESSALQRAFEHFGLKFSRNPHLKIYREINSGVWLDFENNKISAERLKIERFERLFKHLDMKMDSYDFSNTYLRYLSESVHLLNGAEELVKELQGRYKLAILTNGLKEVQYSRFRASVLSKYIDNIIVSEEAGFPKPNPEIFEFTFSNLNHESKRSAIILGDNLSSDIQGGINFGIDTCWYNPDAVNNDTGILPTYEINRLDEFPGILKK